MEQILEHADEKALSFVVFCDNESATYAASRAATSVAAHDLGKRDGLGIR